MGEIRDVETAEIALHAALTGHLVLSTIHTNDAAGVIPRLIDLGIKPQILSPAIDLTLAQRLLRKLCPSCKKKIKVNPEQLKKIKANLGPIKDRFELPELSSSLEIYTTGQCANCDNTGYKDRIGVFEAFVVSNDIERLILSSPPMSAVRDMAVAEGMITILQDAYLKLIAGITSIEEIERTI